MRLEIKVRDMTFDWSILSVILDNTDYLWKI